MMNTECTIYRTADLIGKRWTLLILLELSKGKENWKRYTEIKDRIPDITPKILSSRLKDLIDSKIIEKKTDTKVMPVKTLYTLTESGQDFIKIIKDIKVWALRWNIKNKVCKSTDCSDCIF